MAMMLHLLSEVNERQNTKVVPTPMKKTLDNPESFAIEFPSPPFILFDCKNKQDYH